MRYEGDRETLIVGSKGSIRLTPMWHRSPSIIVKRLNKDDTIIDNLSFGLNYETEHFNTLLREGETESPIMSLSDSFDIMKIMDTLRAQWNLKYPSEL